MFRSGPENWRTVVEIKSQSTDGIWRKIKINFQSNTRKELEYQQVKNHDF